MNDPRSVKVDDAQTILWCAEILQTSEFEVFEMAYRAWYREQPEVARLERVFADYMFDEVVPFWVRQFTRTILDENDGWRSTEEESVGEFLSAWMRTAICTAGLALSLFLPHVVFPWIDTDYAAFPA